MMVFLFLLLLAMLLPGCGSQEPADPILIVAGDSSFSFTDLAPRFRQYGRDSAIIVSTAQTIANRELILADARARGLDTLPEVERRIYERRRERLQYAYLLFKLNQVAASDDTVRSFYDQLGTVVVYHTLTLEDSAAAESLCELLSVSGVEEFERAARSSSCIYQDRIDAGRVGPIDVLMLNEMDREPLAGLEPGETAEPFSTALGWRLVRLDSLYESPPPPFEEAEEAIRAGLTARLQEIYKRSVDDSLRAARNLAIGEGVPELIAEHARSAEGDEMFSPFEPEVAASPAYTFDGGMRSIEWLTQNIRDLPPMAPGFPDDPEWVRGYCGILGLYDIMMLEAEARGFDTLPDMRDRLASATGGVLLDAYYETVIGPRSVATEEDLREFFEANSDMLIVPEMRSARVVVAYDDEQKDMLAGLLERGEDPFDTGYGLGVLGGYTVPGDSTLIRPVPETHCPGGISEVLFSLEDTLQVVACTLSTGALVAVRLVDVLPEHPASFEEARADIEPIVRRNCENEFLADLVDSLSRAYPYEVNVEALSRFWAGAEADSTDAEDGPEPGR
ncbi:hypothetical protein JW921_11485 [Candidatus Fermentibacterales bacterium]|nr:hypothetical protein [Candidatus Fermentibacterales bacterium]